MLLKLPAIIIIFTITLLSQTKPFFLFNNNNLSIAIDNRGIFADTDTLPGGKFKNKSFLFSGGFFISGKHSDTSFASAVASASRIVDYISGNIAGDISSKIIYSVSKDDPPFSSSWLQWKTAVQYGADFYDGNNDRVYDPIDVNNNNLWDQNEDKPLFLGDLNTYTVYNDAAPLVERRYPAKPLGVEINQSTFSFNSTGSYLDNFLFVKYKIINKSAGNLDSVVFSPWADIDLGDVNDDKIGSLKEYNSIYAYNESTDPQLGSNVPTPFLSIILGPNLYVPGISFKDNDNNGIFDIVIDSVITQGYNITNNISVKSFPGSININNNSNNFYMSSDPDKGDPSSSTEARNYALGLGKTGNVVNPCSFVYGKVFSEDCTTINPLFYFTGDPFAKTGWLCSPKTDMRMQINSGIFNLKNNESQEILIAYHVGEGSTTAEGYYKGMADLDSLFNDLGITKYYPTSVQDKPQVVLTNYELYNCYPNPFNPSTTIRFDLPKDSKVSLKVFNLLGKEVAELINSEMQKGQHEVKFDASKLASGLYLYTIKANDFSSTKKMILMK